MSDQPPTSFFNAILREKMPEFIANTRNPIIESTDMSMPMKDDGTRYLVSGLNPIAGMTAVTKWENIEFKGCSISAGPNSQFTNCRFHTTTVNVDGDGKLNLNFCEVFSSTVSATMLETQDCKLKAAFIASRPKLHWKDAHSVIDLARIEAREVLGSGFINTNFQKCIITSSAWREVNLNNVTFGRCQFESSMKFDRCFWHDVVIDREVLESLGSDRGGLSDSIIRKLTVVDPVADLRMIFGGSLFYIHVVAMSLFLAQYAGFIVWKLILAWTTAGHPHETDLMLTALVKFAFLGINPSHGVFGVTHSVLRSVTFLAFLLYNAARLILLLKSLELEHKKAIIGIWPEFSTSDRAAFLKWNLPHAWTWKRLMHVVKVGTLLAVVCAAYQFVSMLTITVPE